ncbi:MAG: UDP-N-acetylglucosamine 1-carboxyvinyltransferase [Flavobacteriaceae bacterium]|nr:UDP-N-acetylglucosamine 1-carboxyvinyltransferase [Flavobacteriaceae bacterium]MCY4266521.1 UDP-N-acetylglucosamine 1-carboxyvinyltransferase [Flavobacteriaceae bacterium]MCY4299821.1 UDP-N-acetylglucosamine 1-carboxyvinyltransferase [Flavobacteriaceae bacterium]
MGSFHIEGGHQLSGVIEPQGAKNEALQVLTAVLLTDQEVTIENIPEILDTLRLIDILKKIGVTVTKKEENTYCFKTEKIHKDYIFSKRFNQDCGRLRGSILLIGPLLGRLGRAILPQIGGDKIGRRRIDTHINGFLKLGATLKHDATLDSLFVEGKQLQGASMILEEASITGTANIVMTACMTKGKTSIYNAACEPYLQQLCRMLNAMGAQISGIGSNLLIIEGQNQLKGTTHKILPDFIEIGSWIGLAAMTKSELTIKNVGWEHLGVVPHVFRKLGLTINKIRDDIQIPAHQHGYTIHNYLDDSILTISDAPWPGFTPDLLSVVLVVATQANGSLLIHQKMFESRLFFVDKLIDMGAKIILCDPHRATVIGHNFKTQLKATTMSSPDIRAGISLLIAALSARGKSIIHNIEQIDRGYQNIDQRLSAIGARIQRVD